MATERKVAATPKRWLDEDDDVELCQPCGDCGFCNRAHDAPALLASLREIAGEPTGLTARELKLIALAALAKVGRGL